MIPLRYAPVTLELELADDPLDPIFTAVTGDGTVATHITTANTSLLWEINNAQVKTDACVLDNALDNSYAQRLLSSKSLPISHNTFVSQAQTIAGQSAPLINVSRALTRRKSIFVMLQNDYTAASNRINLIGRKKWNDFFSPMSIHNVDGAYSSVSDGEFEAQLQIGSKLFPEYPIRSRNEAYYQLKKTLGVHSSSVHNLDISSVAKRD